MNKQEIYKYLNGKIEFCERYVKVLQNKVDNYDKVPQGPLDPFEEQPKEYYIESLNDYKYMLNIYQQIKVKLEAWEVVKNSTIQIKETFVDKDCNDNVVITIIFKEKDFGTFEKALEVKDEKED